jgi:hypothetical protein
MGKKRFLAVVGAATFALTQPSRLRQPHRAQESARPSSSRPAGTASILRVPSRRTRTSTVSLPANWKQWSRGRL